MDPVPIRPVWSPKVRRERRFTAAPVDKMATCYFLWQHLGWINHLTACMLCFFPPWVVLVEQITTHMCDGPPISILNLGFLPLMRQLKIVRVRNRAGSTSLIKESLVWFAAGGSWQEIAEERVWIQLTFRPMSEPSVLNQPVVDVGLWRVVTQLLRIYHDPLLSRRRCRTK